MSRPGYHEMSYENQDGAFPGAKTFPGTRLVFLGSIAPFLGIAKGFPGAFWFLGTNWPFLGIWMSHLRSLTARSGPTLHLDPFRPCLCAYCGSDDRLLPDVPPSGSHSL
jgi:hypothetical protein